MAAVAIVTRAFQCPQYYPELGLSCLGLLRVIRYVDRACSGVRNILQVFRPSGYSNVIFLFYGQRIGALGWLARTVCLIETSRRRT